MIIIWGIIIIIIVINDEFYKTPFTLEIFFEIYFEIYVNYFLSQEKF